MPIVDRLVVILNFFNVSLRKGHVTMPSLMVQVFSTKMTRNDTTDYTPFNLAQYKVLLIDM